MDKTIKTLVKQKIPKAISYVEYRNLVGELAKEDKSTGSEQTTALAQYTKLNDRRMKRWDKTLKFPEEAVKNIMAVNRKITWVVLTESWCGDASPALPVMHKITELNPNISLKILLRDEHPELMNRFLTNGSMSIPKLIEWDESTQSVTRDWGPRSANATRLVEEHKALHGKILPEFKQDIQVWYNADKGQSILAELVAILKGS